MHDEAWDYRTGLGEDVHALVPGRRLLLGGVEIAHDRWLLGHSDADALLHAITDAVLGAAGLGDIGALFPDDDPRHAGADSRELLAQAMLRVRAQAPRLAPHREAMRQAIAASMGMPAERVNVKAKTSERLGFVGREEGIATSAACLLRRGRGASAG
jgi:2-C-methyl-D-erythritol 2,4-cyclodiphosphate synthase